jgi:hypothetical protein
MALWLIIVKPVRRKIIEQLKIINVIVTYPILTLELQHAKVMIILSILAI